MEIVSINRVFDLYLGKIRETVYKIKEDQNHKQVVEQVIFYAKLPKQEPVKGSNVDITV